MNIMLKIEENSKSIVKIADLGLAKLHEYAISSTLKTEDILIIGTRS